MKKIIRTDNAPEAIGPYSQAVISKKSGLIFTAMQIGLDRQTGELKGDDIESQTRQTFENLKSILDEAGSCFDNVVKATLYLADIDDFVKVNDLYSEYFSRDYPARAAIEAAQLPKNALIGIELVAE